MALVGAQVRSKVSSAVLRRRILGVLSFSTAFVASSAILFLADSLLQ